MNTLKKILTLFSISVIMLSGCNSESDGISAQSESSTTTVSTEIISTEPTTRQYEYIVNTSTNKFHSPSCPSVDLMNEENKLYFSGNRENLIKYGYEPCGRCKP